MTGDELRAMRMEMGWKQSFLAEALEVSRSSLAHWEQWRAPVPRDVAKRVRRAHKLVMRGLEGLRPGW